MEFQDSITKRKGGPGHQEEFLTLPGVQALCLRFLGCNEEIIISTLLISHGDHEHQIKWNLEKYYINFT